MATIYDINSTNSLDWAMPFQRTAPYPLDRSLLFDSIDDAKAYASGGNDKRGLSKTSYVGQIISVIAKNDKNEDEVSIYKITPQHTIEKIDIPFPSDSNGDFILNGGDF